MSLQRKHYPTCTSNLIPGTACNCANEWTEDSAEPNRDITASETWRKCIEGRIRILEERATERREPNLNDLNTTWEAGERHGVEKERKRIVGIARWLMSKGKGPSMDFRQGGWDDACERIIVGAENGWDYDAR